jgi:Mg-chelatase subunit ChlD
MQLRKRKIYKKNIQAKVMSSMIASLANGEGPQQVSLTIHSRLLSPAERGADFSPDHNEEYVMMRIESPDLCQTRIPSDIVLVVDVSGSMGLEARVKGVDSTGLSLLDIVKHAVNTVIKILGPQDRLALVSFSNSADVLFNFMPMSETNKKLAVNLVQNLVANGMTNLWDGLEVSLNLLKNRVKDPHAQAGALDKNSVVLLLTDGEPNVEPPNGYIGALKSYCDSNGGRYPGLISTFGFGYSLDSRLLRSIAREGGGMWGFIPDSNFVGTAFVNALSNILVTVTHDAKLNIEPATGVK